MRKTAPKKKVVTKRPVTTRRGTYLEKSPKGIVKKMGFSYEGGKWGPMPTLGASIVLGHGIVGVGPLGVFGEGPSAIGFYRYPKEQKIGSFFSSDQERTFISALQFDDPKAIDVVIEQLERLKATYKNSEVFYHCFDEIALAS